MLSHIVVNYIALEVHAYAVHAEQYYLSFDLSLLCHFLWYTVIEKTAPCNICGIKCVALKQMFEDTIGKKTENFTGNSRHPPQVTTNVVFTDKMYGPLNYLNE